MHVAALMQMKTIGYLCIYRHIYIGDWGEIIDAGDPNREIGFVSCLCRACERAGEAKLCGRVREQCLSTLATGPQNENKCSGLGCSFCVFAVIRYTYSWVFYFFRTDCCYAHGLFDLFLFSMVLAVGYRCGRGPPHIFGTHPPLLPHYHSFPRNHSNLKKQTNIIDEYS